MAPSNVATRQYVGDLKPGDRVEDQVFLIASKDLRTTSQGALYIHAVLTDKTGQVPARMWQATEAIYQSMPVGGFLRFKGRAESYKGSLQFIIEGIRPVSAESIDLGEFLPHTPRDVDEMWGQVKAILRTIRNRDLLALLAEFVQDEAFVASFKKAPAATQLHHSYIGGLLEHTLNVLELARAVTPLYPDLSQDLVLAGVFLHDIGKTTELAYETNFQYTDGGQLVGHIVQAAVWVERKARVVEQATGRPFPRPLLDVLLHVIVAHHGSYQFGSPKLPCVAEAMLIHYLDNIDAKMQMFRFEINSDPDPDSNWTQYVRALETRIFKPDVTGNGP